VSEDRLSKVPCSCCGDPWWACRCGWSAGHMPVWVSEDGKHVTWAMRDGEYCPHCGGRLDEAGS
jgi:hypothetical protein